MAIKIKLLHKKIFNGRKSLYLDFYPAIPKPGTGELMQRKFLGMYIHENPRNAIEKQHNAEQMKLAEAICQKCENELNKSEIYNEYEKERLCKFQEITNKHYSSNRSNRMSALIYLKQFTGGKVKFADLNERYLEGFNDVYKRPGSLSQFL